MLACPIRTPAQYIDAAVVLMLGTDESATMSAARSALAAGVGMGELTAERPARPPVSFSFCTQSTAMESPLFARRNPIVGFANVCAGMLTRVQMFPTLTLVQVVPPSIVISIGPEPLSR